MIDRRTALTLLCSIAGGYGAGDLKVFTQEPSSAPFAVSSTAFEPKLKISFDKDVETITVHWKDVRAVIKMADLMEALKS